MADNVIADETNPVRREVVQKNLRKIIRFVISFDMVVYGICFGVQMWEIHQLFTMDKRFKNGTLVRIAPFNLTTTNAGYFRLAGSIIDLMFRLFPFALLFIATSKSNNENDPKRCVCLIKTSLSIYTILDVFYILYLLGLISEEENDRTKGVKWVMLCAGVHKLVFLLVLYSQACRLLNFLPVVTVYPSTIGTNYMEPYANGGQSQMIIVVAQSSASASPQAETKPKPPEAVTAPKPG